MSEAPRPADIEALVEAFQASDCTELHLRCPGFELHLSTDRVVQGEPPPSSPAPPVPGVPTIAATRTVLDHALPGPTPQPTSGGGLDGMDLVRAPYLGVFYRSPKPGDPPYVEIGQAVRPETDVCLIEVMKLFTTVRAGMAGKLARVLTQDGAMVEAGQPLFAIELCA